MSERKLKEHWCQEKLEFCRPDGTNEAHQEVVKILEREIMGNHKLEIKEDPTLYLDQDTFMLLYKADITLKILQDAQHDGHLWTEKEIRTQENELIERIMTKLKVHVTTLVLKTNPFGIHAH